ncbi:Uncharacterized protein APZ42_023292 [Daphnia magna]|uniref:Uncharacterized protein n=1 Tax=Daphnia magna TaxID=35525 RepID=A0A164V351_9CRUS|nr:Uncharacterized protein APZ42_023292 [Daphnia magna]
MQQQYSGQTEDTNPETGETIATNKKAIKEDDAYCRNNHSTSQLHDAEHLSVHMLFLVLLYYFIWPPIDSLFSPAP